VHSVAHTLDQRVILLRGGIGHPLGDVLETAEETKLDGRLGAAVYD
jgi:hypothetical protein